LEKGVDNLTHKGYCKICAFFNDASWLRDGFQKKVAEGGSLRILKAYLEGLGCKVDLKTISSHVKHMDFQVIDQRRYEKSLRKKTFDSIQKIRHFFKPEEPIIPSNGCEHLKTSNFYDVSSEEVLVQCDTCGQILGSCAPDQQRKRMQRDQRNWVLLEACKKTTNRRS
jgi:hypothetical protein